MRDAVSLAVGLVPASRRAGFAALLALDARLAQTVASTRETMVGQMRLAWWREALTALYTAPAPAEPILRDIAAHVLGLGVSGSSLAGMTVGWEALLLGESGDAVARETYAAERGGRLFEVAGQLLGGEGKGVAAAGRGWALADLARHSTRRDGVEAVSDEAIVALDAGLEAYWPPSLRPLGTLALLARAEIDSAGPNGSGWRRAYSFAKFRLTGRR